MVNLKFWFQALAPLQIEIVLAESLSYIIFLMFMK